MTRVNMLIRTCEVVGAWEFGAIGLVPSQMLGFDHKVPSRSLPALASPGPSTYVTSYFQLTLIQRSPLFRTG